ncbi:GntR family transcriptional regulator [Marinitenerispora sediminis]|uniref:GntR family transcriptional regulator n=1 Tax=Marinitenerispora sediminis TaxID=1931232 RepID=A0A368TB44_9ACTN|nr:GntR family transcriptional regulator [Marinitenerispora sediminis]RCV50798.1 GntR family transcriptional regulator [Marinitenerispora sediminis]RCV55025.1 GntR family transcriptional regulator [Marinitenerispora sediminis]RCV62064.1 GntR family transcriptional regulator [Marinitenerispora sediminis]
MHPTPSATDRTYQFTKEAILSRHYAGGELISEGDIAARVGVSRTPVREALLRLEAEGLVRLYPKRGALVVPVSQQEVDDVIETRRLVEGFTAERAAAAPTERRRELVARLGALLERMTERAPADRREFVLADREFHRAIVTAAGNQILTALYESLRDRQLRMMEEGVRTAERMRSSIEDHGAIRAAIEAGDAARARAVVHSHIDAAAALLGARR